MERRGDFSGSDNTKKTMEETMYWKHFDTVRFSVQLPRDFTTQLALPKAWTDKYMSASHQDVILRLSGQENKEWRARYNFDKTRCLGQFTGGWVYFALDNALHEFDVCVFTLAGRKGGNVCLDVKIIKVIEEEVDEFLLSDGRSGHDTQERRSTHDVVVGLRSMDGRM